MLLDRCSVLTVLSVPLVYCGQTVGWNTMRLGMVVGPRPWPHCVRWGPSCPHGKGHISPHFRDLCAQAACVHIIRGPCLLCPNAGWIKMSFGVDVGLGPAHIVLDGDPAPPPKKGTAVPQFSAHVYYGQTAGWINMKLGLEVCLGPGHIVLDGNAAPSPLKGHSPQIIGRCLLWPNGWLDQDATWYRDRLRTRRHCIRWGRSSSSPKGHSLPVFGPCLS